MSQEIKRDKGRVKVSGRFGMSRCPGADRRKIILRRSNNFDFSSICEYQCLGLRCANGDYIVVLFNVTKSDSRYKACQRFQRCELGRLDLLTR